MRDLLYSSANMAAIGLKVELNHTINAVFRILWLGNSIQNIQRA